MGRSTHTVTTHGCTHTVTAAPWAPPAMHGTRALPHAEDVSLMYKHHKRPTFVKGRTEAWYSKGCNVRAVGKESHLYRLTVKKGDIMVLQTLMVHHVSADRKEGNQPIHCSMSTGTRHSCLSPLNASQHCLPTTKGV